MEIVYHSIATQKRNLKKDVAVAIKYVVMIVQIRGTKMSEYYVGCSAFGLAIYAGILEPKTKHLWKDKNECTDEAIEAVRDYMVENCLGGIDCKKSKSGGYEWKLKDGRRVQLTITIKEIEEND